LDLALFDRCPVGVLDFGGKFGFNCGCGNGFDSCGEECGFGCGKGFCFDGEDPEPNIGFDGCGEECGFDGEDPEPNIGLLPGVEE
jgi:hypothetical protein